MAQGFFECIGRTPFGSLLAFIMVIVGAAVFCGTLYRALTLIIEGILVQLFGFTLSWLEVVQIMFVVIGVVMAVISIILLVFAFLATGATRQNVYSGARCIMGGRISAGLFIIISFVLSMAWIVISCISLIPVLFYVSVDGVCNREIFSHTAQELDDMNYCFELSRFGIYRRAEGEPADSSSGSDQLCEHTELRTMCNRVGEAGPLFCVAFGSSIVILLGMIVFLVCLAANYTRIKISKELTQYRDAVEMEELDVNSDPHKGPPPYLIDTRSSIS